MEKRKKRVSAGAKPITYAQAGVSIEEGDALVDFLRGRNRALARALGGFSGLGTIPREYKRPRLVMSTDGVGTKLLVAQLAGKHDTIGIDLVAMVVNDLIVTGARPLYFLDYFATGKLERGVAQRVLDGIIRGCEEAQCALIGGETAEMPGMYAPGHYDLAGFGVGVVDEGKQIDGHRVKKGDIVLGIASSGVHSNGYSLVRRALLPKDDGAARRALRAKFERGRLADELLRPTRIYVRLVADLLKRFPISAMAHITGGGIEGNLARVLPKGTRACIRLGSWTPPPIFDLIAREGPVERAEMYRAFNMGIGYMIIARPNDAAAIQKRCRALRYECTAIGWIDGGASRGAEPEVLLLESDS